MHCSRGLSWLRFFIFFLILKNFKNKIANYMHCSPGLSWLTSNKRKLKALIERTTQIRSQIVRTHLTGFTLFFRLIKTYFRRYLVASTESFSFQMIKIYFRRYLDVSTESLVTWRDNSINSWMLLLESRYQLKFISIYMKLQFLILC